MPIVDDIAGLRRILARSRTLAVVGLSAQWYRPSYFAAKYMQDHGYRIIPVNPRYAEVLGERCYPDLRSIPEAVDIVDCFGKPAEIPAIAEDAIAIGAKVVWMQLGDEPLRQDRARADPRRPQLGWRQHPCDQLETSRGLLTQPRRPAPPPSSRLHSSRFLGKLHRIG